MALPVQLTEAIEQKQKADQESRRMEFILTKEKQEADRKRIEAKGIADFQTIVAAGISEQLLRWKGIEATEKLAGSSNSKVVIIGAGNDGLPVILDTKQQPRIGLMTLLPKAECMNTAEKMAEKPLWVRTFRSRPENEQHFPVGRPAAMQRTDKNIAGMLSEPGGSFHRVRREKIDEELLGVVSGCEALMVKSA